MLTASLLRPPPAARVAHPSLIRLLPTSAAGQGAVTLAHPHLPLVHAPLPVLCLPPAALLQVTEQCVWTSCSSTPSASC